MPAAELPAAESLKDTLARVLPYWNERIAPELAAGRNVLVAAHGNSLRALVKMLDGMSDAAIVEFNIPTGVPLLYELDDNLKPRSQPLPRRCRGDQGARRSRGARQTEDPPLRLRLTCAEAGSGQEAAVDDEQLARDISRRVRSQEYGGACDVRARPHDRADDCQVVLELCSSAISAPANFVRIRPGRIALQRIPCGPHSFANNLVMFSTAPLVIE